MTIVVKLLVSRLIHPNLLMVGANTASTAESVIIGEVTLSEKDIKEQSIVVLNKILGFGVVRDAHNEN